MTPPQVAVGAVLLVALSVTVLASAAYGLWKWSGEGRGTQLPMWRRVASSAGFFAVIVQGATFIAFWGWPSIGRDSLLSAQWARWVLASFLVAVPCVLAGKGASRWWLFSSSAFLFVICLFLGLSA